MQQQDSNDPTGVAVVEPSKDTTNIARARQRKIHAAIELRLSGARWDDIAQVVGYPTGRQALVAVERALEKELLSQGDRDTMRRLVGARLERLLGPVWTKAINPDHPDQIAAVREVRGILQDHVKVFGLAAPTEVIIHNPTAAEIEAWVGKVVATQTPDVQEYDILELDPADITEGEPYAVPAE